MNEQANTPALAVNDKVPQVVFKTRVRDESDGGDNPFVWKDVTTDEIFDGRRVAIFSLPGAFTPTCSSTHLPGFESKYDELRAKGVDEVYTFGPGFSASSFARQGHFPSANEFDLESFVARLEPGDSVLVKGSNKVFWKHSFVERLTGTIDHRG